ncbi:hypothetical protein L3X38_022052 [Prunus dulcis]|uniref:Uncharacterized protein n=1 Tax=Prunus dulcis TaxID=3755 RepID=A0AAD4VV83_PRUDU|nr:hypothetical protein L3X38_022052 [Prunus dulcis]
MGMVSQSRSWDSSSDIEGHLCNLHPHHQPYMMAMQEANYHNLLHSYSDSSVSASPRQVSASKPSPSAATAADEDRVGGSHHETLPPPFIDFLGDLKRRQPRKAWEGPGELVGLNFQLLQICELLEFRWNNRSRTIPDCLGRCFCAELPWLLRRDPTGTALARTGGTKGAEEGKNPINPDGVPSYFPEKTREKAEERENRENTKSRPTSSIKIELSR